MVSTTQVASTVTIKDESTLLFAGDSDKDFNVLTPFAHFTQDGGMTWTSSQPNINPSFSTYIENSDSIYIISGQFDPDNGTVISYDNCNTWSFVDNTRILAADFSPSGKGLGSFGNLEIFGNFPENGNLYEWEFELPTATYELANSALKIIPNPASNYLTVQTDGVFQTEKLQLTIIASNGKIVHQNHVANQERIETPIANLPKGIYTLRLNGEQKSLVKKFIKM